MRVRAADTARAWGYKDVILQHSDLAHTRSSQRHSGPFSLRICYSTAPAMRQERIMEILERPMVDQTTMNQTRRIDEEDDE